MRCRRASFYKQNPFHLLSKINHYEYQNYKITGYTKGASGIYSPAQGHSARDIDDHITAPLVIWPHSTAKL